MTSATLPLSAEPSAAAPLALAPRPSGSGVAAAFESALRARAPSMHATTPLVCRLASRVGRELRLDAESLELLDVAVRMRDVGMIGLPDSVVLAIKPLSPSDWELVNRHPVLGQGLLEAFDEMSPVAPIVRAHHERWDGGGYPDGLSGEEIPLLSRIIATCDAFVAIASDRPHRRGLGAEAALEVLVTESGAQFDPATVRALTASLTTGTAPSEAAAPETAARPRSRPTGGDEGSQNLRRAIAEFDVVPVLAPAYERILTACASDRTLGGELVAAAESDIGLTVAVLRAAQKVAGDRTIANVSDAVTALGSAGVDAAVRPLPRAEFPWRTSQLQVVMHRSLVHAQAVARATDRIARELDLAQRDDALAVALLHDVGKLALSRGVQDYPGDSERTLAPEDRVRKERQTWGMDHASIGGVLLLRWGLPKRLASVVAAHHSAEAEHDLATYVRLADMVAHHAQGDQVDSAKMLGLAQLCELSATALREILFDLPHSGGSHRRRAEPSPLSERETAVVRQLAEGKRYKEIALELHVTASTVRTHLHNVYAKIGVDDRAQAVLRATEMGWI